MENQPYRVVQVHRDRYLVRNETDEYYCVLTGSLRYRDAFPVVGDYVEIMVNPYGDSLIQAILPRRTAFFRPDRGGHADGFVKTMQVQPLIANMDYVFIITSLNHDFSPNRIARYAAMTVAGGATPVAVLTKADLCPNAEEMEAKVSALSRDLQTVTISSFTGYGLDRLRAYFTPGVTIALLGSSGAGKSTLINTLAGSEIMRTGGIREEDAKGRHTTTTARLLKLSFGGYVVDTPGVRQFMLWDIISEEVMAYFRDLCPYENLCKFSDCTHTHENGCAVKDAVADGRVDARRYASYLSIRAGEMVDG